MNGRFDQIHRAAAAVQRPLRVWAEPAARNDFDFVEAHGPRGHVIEHSTKQ